VTQTRERRGSKFRLRRTGVPPADCALVEKIRWRIDRIDKETWNGIQKLPDEVSLQTSDFNGTALRRQHELWGAWVEGIGFRPDASLWDDDVFWEVAYEIEAEWQAATFAALHGYYRQAIETLRAALERVVIGARFQNDAANGDFACWIAGGELKFQPLCDQLHKQYPSLAKLNASLHAHGCPSLVEPKKCRQTNDWVGTTYAKLCSYAHIRSGHAHGDLWRSNGPVYDRKAFVLVDGLFQETLALCWVLAKLARPSMTLPEAVSALFRSGRSSWAKSARVARRFLAPADTRI
jgi:hypothetical protein